MMTNFAFPDLKVFKVDLYPSVTGPNSLVPHAHILIKEAPIPFPDFMTSARRELMLSAVRFVFLGAIIMGGRPRKSAFKQYAIC